MSWALFRCDGGDAYAQKNLSLPGDYWAQVDIQIPASALTACSDGDLFGGSAFVLSLLNSGLGRTNSALIIDNDYPHGDAWDWYTDNATSANDTSTAFAADTSYTIKAHWNGTSVEWFIDGSSVGTRTVPSGAPTGGITVGGFSAEGCTCEWYYATNVKVGTSDGGTDIFADDFSGGTFSSWDSTSGTCLVVTTPASDCTVPPRVGVADTIDTTDGPQDLATWSGTDDDGFVIFEMSMVKFSDGSFWVAELDDVTPQVRKIASDGTQTVYPIEDQISPSFPYLPDRGAYDAILGTDGTNIWLAFLGYDKHGFTDESCVDHVIPQDRTLQSYSLGVAIFADSAPSGSWTDIGPAFYIFGKDAGQTNNAVFTIGSLPPLLPTEDDPELALVPISLVSAFTACASAAQDGLFHVMWGECGYAGGFNPCDYDDGTPSGIYLSRLSYSRWTPSALDTQVDLLSTSEIWGDIQQTGGGAPSIADGVAFCNAVIKNDTGLPVAFVNQIASYSSDIIQTPTQFTAEAEIRMWDLSSPTAGSPDELQNSSGVVPVDLNYLLLSDNFSTSDGAIYLGPPFGPYLHCAAPYDDALLSDEAVYLVSVTYIPTEDSFQRTFILRVPCDGSAAFDFLDGDIAAGVGIVRDAGLGDFVSEPRNVWWPSGVFAGTVAKMMQYDRICSKAWLRDLESPGETSVNCPRGVDLTDDLISFVSFNVADQVNTLTQQIILREVVPCGAGLHVWGTSGKGFQ